MVPEIKDCITYVLTILGFIVTGYFSWAVLKATEKSAEPTKASADAADASFKLSKTILEVEERKEEKIRVAYLQWMKRRIEEIIDALNGQRQKLNHRVIESAPKDIGIETEAFAKYFTVSEQKIILSIFDMLNEYLEDNWLNHDGSIKKAFDGNELNKLLREATLLSNKTDELLNQI